MTTRAWLTALALALALGLLIGWSARVVTTGTNQPKLKGATTP